MAANFTDNWYVLKSRLCLFAPLRDNFEFEIDKSEAGGASLSAPENGASLIKEMNTRFNTVWDSNLNENAPAETPLDYRGTLVKALCFGTGGSADPSQYNRRYVFNSSANAEMNRMMMTPNRTATVNFWIRCITPSSFRLDSPFGYPVRNFAVASKINDGVVLGADFALINYGKFRTAGTPTAETNKYILRLLDKKLGELSASDTSPGAINSENINKSYSTPAGSGTSTGSMAVWFMVTHVLEFGANSDEGIVVETHVRYRDDDDDYVHLALRQNQMDPTLWENEGGSAIWSIGLPSDYDTPLTDDNQIAIRNFMVYEARLDDSQQKRIFENGIDPFQAELENVYDFDQHDRNYWGSYGILGTRSNLRIEKSIFTTGGVAIYDTDGINDQLPSEGKTHGLPFRKWADKDSNTPSVEISRREHIALRDNSMLVMIGEQQPDTEGIKNYVEPDGTQNFYATKWKDFAIDTLGSFDGTISREPYSTEVTQRYIYPSLNAEGKVINYYTNRPSIISWRNSRIAGTRSTDPYRVWLSEGSTFNGFSDAVMIADMAHPEDLPSGTYVASLNYNPDDLDYLSTNPQTAAAATTAKGYPKHIGMLKFQYEAGAINYSNSFTYSGNGGKTLQTSSPIFWETQPRYIVMDWDAKAESGASYGTPVQYDALAWKPVVWRYVVYEVQEASKLGDRDNLNAGNYQGKIVMHLFGDPVTFSGNSFTFESNRYRYCAIYEKPYIRAFDEGSTTERDYGGWNFVSFQPDNSENLAEQFANRIYLPRITIPHIKIPVLRPKLTVIKGPQSEIFIGGITDDNVYSDTEGKPENTKLWQRRLFIAGNMAFYKGGDDGWSRSAGYATLNGTINKKSNGSYLLYHDNQEMGEANDGMFCPLSSGWYELNIQGRSALNDRGGRAMYAIIDMYQGNKKVKNILNARINGGARASKGASVTGWMNVATNKLVWLDAPTADQVNAANPDFSSWPVYKFYFTEHEGGGWSDVGITIQLVSPSQSVFNQVVSGVDIGFDVIPDKDEKGASGGETPQRFAKYVTSEPSPVDSKISEQWIHLFNVEALYGRYNKTLANGAQLVTNAAETAEPQITDAAAVTDVWVNPTPYQEDKEPNDQSRTRNY